MGDTVRRNTLFEKRMQIAEATYVKKAGGKFPAANWQCTLAGSEEEKERFGCMARICAVPLGSVCSFEYGTKLVTKENPKLKVFPNNIVLPYQVFPRFNYKGKYMSLSFQLDLMKKAGYKFKYKTVVKSPPSK